MDPIEKLERDLRDVINDVLAINYGPDWHNLPEIGLGPEWARKLEEKANIDRKAQGDPTVYEIPISYTEFSDLGALLNKHQKLFQPIFPSWGELTVYLQVAGRLRNTIKHHRDIGKSQDALLDGIAAEISDAITFWKIGARLNQRAFTFQFTDYIETKPRSEEVILKDSRDQLKDWKSRIQSAALAHHLNLVDTVDEEYQYIASGGNVSFRVITNPDTRTTSAFDNRSYKSITCEFAYNMSCHAPLEGLIGSIGKTYRHITFDMEDDINVAALAKWSNERAGLMPSSSVAMNDSLTSIEFGLLQGKIRIGVNRQFSSKGKPFGRLQLTVETPTTFWHPHNTITPRHLIGYALGNITPKTFLQLIRSSET